MACITTTNDGLLEVRACDGFSGMTGDYAACPGADLPNLREAVPPEGAERREDGCPLLLASLPAAGLGAANGEQVALSCCPRSAGVHSQAQDHLLVNRYYDNHLRNKRTQRCRRVESRGRPEGLWTAEINGAIGVA
jgi:hypothetical protein